jgi:uncharacterized paraquat-inducible protein A
MGELLTMAKYKPARPSDKAKEVTKTEKPVYKQKKNNLLRILAVVFAAMLLISMAVIFPMQGSGW